MEFAFTMQCFLQRPNVFLVRQAMNATHLPTDFFYFNILQESFYCHFCGQSQEWKRPASATYRNVMKLVRGSQPPAQRPLNCRKRNKLSSHKSFKVSTSSSSAKSVITRM